MSPFWLVKRIKSIVVYGDTTPATIGSILSSMLWCLCLCFPGTLIGPPGVGRPTYRYMYELATEQTWIFVFMSIFMLQIWRMFCSFRYTKHRNITFAIELVIKIWAAQVWTFIAIACMLAQYPPAAAMSDAIVIAIGCWWDMLRCERLPMQCLECHSAATHHCGWCPYEKEPISDGRHT